MTPNFSNTHSIGQIMQTRNTLFEKTLDLERSKANFAIFYFLLTSIYGLIYFYGSIYTLWFDSLILNTTLFFIGSTCYLTWHTIITNYIRMVEINLAAINTYEKQCHYKLVKELYAQAFNLQEPKANVLFKQSIWLPKLYFLGFAILFIYNLIASIT